MGTRIPTSTLRLNKNLIHADGSYGYVGHVNLTLIALRLDFKLFFTFGQALFSAKFVEFL